MRQLYNQAEPHIRLPGLTGWHQPRKFYQKKFWKPACGVDHRGARSCGRSGGVGAVALQRGHILYIANLHTVPRAKGSSGVVVFLCCVASADTRLYFTVRSPPPTFVQ